MEQLLEVTLRRPVVLIKLARRSLGALARSHGVTMQFPAGAATYKAWCDKLIEGLLIAFCVIMAFFLTGAIKDAVVAVIVDTPIFSTVKCGLVERALSSPYFPDTLKGRELGIRYRTGCHKN